MKEIQGLVFLYTILLVSAKMSFDDFGKEAYPLPHSKEFLSAHEEYSESQFSSKSKMYASVSQTETQTSKIHNNDIEQIDSNETTTNYTKQNNKIGANNTVIEMQTNKTENNRGEKTTYTTKPINDNDTTDKTKIEQTDSVNTKPKPTNTPKTDDKTRFIRKTGSDSTDKTDVVENNTEAITTKKEFQKTDKETVENAGKGKASSSISQTQIQTSKIHNKNIEPIDSNETTMKYTNQNNKVSTNNTVIETQTNKTENNSSEKTTNATKQIDDDDTTDQTKFDQSDSVNTKPEPTNTPKIGEKTRYVRKTSSNASDKIDEVENTTEATTTKEEFQKTDTGTVENAGKGDTQHGIVSPPNTVTTKSENMKPLTVLQAGNTHFPKVTTSDTEKKNYLTVGLVNKNKTITSSKKENLLRDIQARSDKSLQFDTQLNSNKPQKAITANSETTNPQTETQANGSSAQRATNIDIENNNLISMKQANDPKSKESTISEKEKHISTETSVTNAQKVSTTATKRNNQITTTKDSPGKLSVQKATSTGNNQDNEQTVMQSNITTAQNNSTKDCKQETNASDSTKPAKSEPTLTDSHKDNEQNIFTSFNRNSKSVFLKRKEEHKKGRYDFKQMDGLKAIHNAIQMDLNFKTLLVEDGSVPGKCFCSCDMNSRPVFIEMDSESLL